MLVVMIKANIIIQQHVFALFHCHFQQYNSLQIYTHTVCSVNANEYYVPIADIMYLYEYTMQDELMIKVVNTAL